MKAKLSKISLLVRVESFVYIQALAECRFTLRRIKIHSQVDSFSFKDVPIFAEDIHLTFYASQ